MAGDAWKLLTQNYLPKKMKCFCRRSIIIGILSMNRYQEPLEAKRLKLKTLLSNSMCKNMDIRIGIKKLDFVSHRGKMMVYLTDGRQVLVPLSFFPDIKLLSVKDRSDWVILDDQFFTFARLSKIYSIEEIMRL